MNEAFQINENEFTAIKTAFGDLMIQNVVLKIRLAAATQPIPAVPESRLEPETPPAPTL